MMEYEQKLASGVFKVFLKQNSTFIPNESVEYYTSPEYVVEYSEGLQTHQNSFRKKMSHLLTPPSLRRVHFVVWPGLPKKPLTFKIT